MQRLPLPMYGIAVVLAATACSNEESSADPWVGNATADSGADGDDGDDDDDGPCSLSPSGKPLVLGDDEGAPGRVTGVAVAGGTAVSCGSGFVAVGSASVDLPGTCTGIVTVDDGTVAAVSESGSVVLVDVAGPTVLASAEAGGSAYDIGVDGTTIAVALGSGGVATFDTAGGSLGAASSLTTALDVRAIGGTGGGWLVGGPGHVTALSADGSSTGTVEVRGSASDVEVADGTGVVGRGEFGMTVVDVGGGLSLVSEIATEGTALDVAIVGDAALVATGAGLHRYELADLALSARVVRPDVAELVGDWITAVGSDGTDAATGIGSDVYALDVSDDSAGAVALLPRTTTSLFAEGSGEVIVLVENAGNDDLILGDLSIDGGLSIGAVEGAEARDGCEDQWAVEPGGSLLITLEGDVPADGSLVDLRVSTNDPNQRELPLPVEVNRPSLAVGDVAPDFSLLSFDGRVVDLAALSGEVVYLKLFSYS